MIDTYNINGIAFIEFSNGSRPNVIDSDFLLDLQNTLDQIEKDESITTLVLKASKRSGFIAGADIKMISAITTREEAENICSLGQQVFRRLNNFSGIPTIALIEGPCLGGGMELALGCNYRIAINSPKTVLGLPEVNLGIIPGFGGTVRLARLVGLEKSIDLICSGKRVDSKKGKKIGIIDEVVADEKQAIEHITQLIATWQTKDSYINRKIPRSLKESRLGRMVIYQLARRSILLKTKGNYPAPSKAVDVIYQGLLLSEEEAYKLEREAVTDLLIEGTAKHLINLFLLQEKHKKTYPGRATEIKTSEMPLPQQTAILGAGLMGGGLAQLFAYKGFTTHLKDIKQEQLDLAISTANKLTQPLIVRSKITEKAGEELLQKINPTLEYSSLANAEFVVEAVVENYAVKKKVLSELEDVVSRHCIIATNTSSLSVTALASECKYPERVIGMHFFSPVHKMPLVEIIPGDQTSPEVIEQTFRLALKLGKIPVFCNDRTCFIVNRILGAYLNEAAWCLLDGYTAEEVDKAMRKFGMPLGPCELMDEVGIIVSNEVAERLKTSWGDRFTTSTLLKQMIEHKLYGKRATKEGFYTYSKSVFGRIKRSLSKKVQKLVDALQPEYTEQLGKKADLSLEERLIGVMRAEAEVMLADKTVDSDEAINLAMILGTGFPPFRGGLIKNTGVESK